MKMLLKNHLIKINIDLINISLHDYKTYTLFVTIIFNKIRRVLTLDISVCKEM